ncbi:urease accessory protein UreF [Ramlibacter tataouinensis]|uniref:urease accessory protein UreF n=1 Tax=Ramlibacter tataouinensis TaxID=94132 RepID=UPI0007775D02|nr:urease accessory protein UreF [Ramlibacter tataouinensis]
MTIRITTTRDTRIDLGGVNTRIGAAVRLLQFGDSLLPVGSFTFSNGIESAVQLGVVHDADTLGEFVHAALQQAAGSDGVALLAAFRGSTACDDALIDDADHAVFNRKLNEESRTMTVRMGRKLAEMAAYVIGPCAASSWLERIRADATPGCYPIAQALVFCALGLSEQEAFAVHQYGLASMMTAASLRLMKLHYLDAQVVLLESNARAEDDYRRIAGLSIEDMAVFSPVIDVLAANHVRATVRMFMN